MVLSLFFGHWKKELTQKIHHVHLTLHSTLENSFHNIGKDMQGIKEWISHLHQKDLHHEKKILRLESRIASLEYYFEQIAASAPTISQPKLLEPKDSGTLWDSLTETQQQICWKLAAIQKEMPNQWISLKYLAQEIYPDKEYGQIRSALSQYVSVLEDMGILNRKRKGKQAFVFSTNKNPCLNKQQPIEIRQ